MAETKRAQIPKRKKAEKKEQEEAAAAPQSRGSKKKLQDLDAFIEGALQEAGEEFLEEFRQIEGE
jgi:hypothetical protein